MTYAVAVSKLDKNDSGLLGRDSSVGLQQSPPAVPVPVEGTERFQLSPRPFSELRWSPIDSCSDVIEKEDFSSVPLTDRVLTTSCARSF
jgi:hypothetical protein